MSAPTIDASSGSLERRQRTEPTHRGILNWQSTSMRPPLANPRSFCGEDSQLNVYAGELEVRPAFALVTTKAVHRPVRRSHEVAKVEARSAKADLRESFGRRATRCAHRWVGWSGARPDKPGRLPGSHRLIRCPLVFARMLPCRRNSLISQGDNRIEPGRLPGRPEACGH
jgi:hypothetical protein